MNDQEILIQQCKDRVGNKNLANEISDLLGVNVDAAYRRMRGTTALTFDEIKKLCLHFNISFDSVINYSGTLVPFQFNAMYNKDFSIYQYLKTIADQLDLLAKGEDNRFVITAMDLPYFRQFGFRSLSRFKLFFWQRSVLNLPEFQAVAFDVKPGDDDQYDEVTQRIFEKYHGVSSTEIWTPETLDSTIKQVQYYAEAGMFARIETAFKICDDIDLLLTKVEQEAQFGKKIADTKSGVVRGNFELYQSDIYLSNNSIQAFAGDKIFTYVSFNSFNSLMSFTPNFSEECHAWIEQIRLKSILLSEVSEKLRYQYFYGLRKKLNDLRALLEHYR
ncbi:MAG: hypothetical protein ACI8ZN_002059 [Bacteroidia bacterium]|jgi:hypothetical protein